MKHFKKKKVISRDSYSTAYLQHFGTLDALYEKSRQQKKQISEQQVE
jgi:hypothetical protein